MSEPSTDNAKALWQSQEQEADPMTLEQIHTLIGKYDNRSRRTSVAIVLAVGFAAFLIGKAWTQTRGVDIHIAFGLYMVGSAVSLIMLMKALYPRRDPAESAGAYLRRRLERRLRHLRGGWTLVCAPLVPAILAIFALGFLRNHGPVWAPILPMAVVAVALVAVLVVTSIRARAVKADLDELERLMGG